MRCTANKRDGSPCTLPAQGSNGLCWAHDPENAEARRKGARKGGKSKPGGDLHMLKQKLITLGDDVLAGNVGRGNAAVAATCYGTAIKAVEAEMRVKEVIESRLLETRLKVEEQREIAGRLEELEALLAQREAG
jgi:hypothetical protein